METYLQLKERQAKEFNNFPMFFAFNDKQFKEGMEKLGLEPSNTTSLCTIGGGSYMKRTDFENFKAMSTKNTKELNFSMRNDYTFAYDMFNHELSNHEYCYTYDTTPTLEALGLSNDDVLNNEILEKALKNAIVEQEARD